MGRSGEGDRVGIKASMVGDGIHDACGDFHRFEVSSL